MKIINKQKGQPFVILNLTDPQLSNREWLDPSYTRPLTETVKRLVEETKPDLITVSGDLAWAAENEAYNKISDFLDSFGIPWAPVLGNHDQRIEDPSIAQTVAEIVSKRPHCVFEAGDPALGVGNYVLRIEEDGQPLHDIILMDTHKNKHVYMPEYDAYDRLGYDDLWPCQMDWYEERIDEAKAAGVKSSSIIMHIPLYNYIEAAAAAFKADVDPCSVPAGDGMQTGCWNEGYESSFGVLHEKICAPDEDDGQFERILKKDHTKVVLVGHDHENSAVIPYRGVILAYALKTGCGCSWNPQSNGGTVLTVESDGTVTVKHCYVDPASLA